MRNRVFTGRHFIVGLLGLVVLALLLIAAFDWLDGEPAFGDVDQPTVDRLTDLDRFREHEAKREEALSRRHGAAVRIPGIGLELPTGSRSCLYTSWSDRTLTCYAMDLSAHPFDGRLKTNAELNAEVLRRYGPLHVGGGNLLGIDAETLYNLGSQDLTRRCRQDQFNTARTHDCFPTFEELYDFAAVSPFWRPTPLEPTPTPTATPRPTATPAPSPTPTPAPSTGDTPILDEVGKLLASNPSGERLRSLLEWCAARSEGELAKLLTRAHTMAAAASDGAPGPDDPAVVPAAEVKAFARAAAGPAAPFVDLFTDDEVKAVYVPAVRLWRAGAGARP